VLSRPEEDTMEAASPPSKERGSAASTSGGEEEEAASTSAGEDVISPRLETLGLEEPAGPPGLDRPPGLAEPCTIAVAADGAAEAPPGVSDARARLRKQGHAVLDHVAHDGTVRRGVAGYRPEEEDNEQLSRGNRRRGRKMQDCPKKTGLEGGSEASSQKSSSGSAVTNTSALERHAALLKVLDSSSSSRKAGLNPDAAVWRPSGHRAPNRRSPPAAWLDTSNFSQGALHADAAVWQPSGRAALNHQRPAAAWMESSDLAQANTVTDYAAYVELLDHTWQKVLKQGDSQSLEPMKVIQTEE